MKDIYSFTDSLIACYMPGIILGTGDTVLIYPQTVAFQSIVIRIALILSWPRITYVPPLSKS